MISFSPVLSFFCDFQSSRDTVLAFVIRGVPVLACILVYARFYSWADSPGPHLLFINEKELLLGLFCSGQALRDDEIMAAGRRKPV